MASEIEQLTRGHYHCIECGTLFESTIREVRDQRCPVCGNPPTGKILAGTALDKSLAQVVRDGTPQPIAPRTLHGVNKDTQEIYEATLEAEGKQRRGHVKRSKRKSKKNRKILMVIGAWIVAMLMVVVLVYTFDQGDDSGAVVQQEDAERQKILAKAEEKKRGMVVSASIPPCEKAMTAFLNAPSAAAKAQYVYQGARLSGVMSRYYQSNPSFSSTRSNIRIISGELLDVPGKKVIGTLCQYSLGERFEAIFVEDDHEWKIDWKSLVRYDPRPWSLFVSGRDGDEGEFRLYMRVRDVDEDLERKEMVVVFYKPGMYSKNEFSGMASKSVRVAIDSEAGMKIQRMLDSEEHMEKDALGFTIGHLDPHRYHRVRVRMRLHKKAGEETHMELVKILANDWYGIETKPAGDASREEDSKGLE